MSSQEARREVRSRESDFGKNRSTSSILRRTRLLLLRSNRLRLLDDGVVSVRRQEPADLTAVRRRIRSNEVGCVETRSTLESTPRGKERRTWESDLELVDSFEVLDLSGSQVDLERSGVLLEVFDLSSSDDGKDVRRLAHDVGEGDCIKSSKS